MCMHKRRGARCTATAAGGSARGLPSRFCGPLSSGTLSSTSAQRTALVCAITDRMSLSGGARRFCQGVKNRGVLHDSMQGWNSRALVVAVERGAGAHLAEGEGAGAVGAFVLHARRSAVLPPKQHPRLTEQLEGDELVCLQFLQAQTKR